MVKHLLKLGVLVNIQDEEGFSPLQVAATNENRLIFEELVKVDGSDEAEYEAEDGPIDVDAQVFLPRLGWMTASDILEYNTRCSRGYHY